MPGHGTTWSRIIDGDPASLDRRVARLLERVGADWRVARFTYWYTGRPPIHEALLVPPARLVGRLERVEQALHRRAVAVDLDGARGRRIVQRAACGRRARAASARRSAAWRRGPSRSRA